jgi:DNA-binding transcriptional ArsR family regulator
VTGRPGALGPSAPNPYLGAMPNAPAAVAETLPSAEELQTLASKARAATRLLKLMASEPRLMLLCQLGQGEHAAGELAQRAGLSQTAASQHLAKLRAEGVVDTRREGQTIYYRLVDPSAARIIELLYEIYCRPQAG